MVLFKLGRDRAPTTGAPDPTDRYSFVPYVDAANNPPAETRLLRFKIKKEAINGFIQQIKDKPNAHLFLAHNQPVSRARDGAKSS